MRHVHKIEYMGSLIRIGEDGLFYTSKEAVADDNDGFNAGRYESLKSAKDAIDRSIKKKNATARRKINLRCISSNGGEYYLRGIHAGHGHYIFSPDFALSHYVHVYPYTEEIKFVIAAIKQLKARADELQQFIDRYSIEEPSLFGGRRPSDDADHAAKIKDLEDLYEQKLKDLKRDAGKLLAQARGEK